MIVEADVSHDKTLLSLSGPPPTDPQYAQLLMALARYVGVCVPVWDRECLHVHLDLPPVAVRSLPVLQNVVDCQAEWGQAGTASEDRCAPSPRPSRGGHDSAGAQLLGRACAGGAQLVQRAGKSVPRHPLTAALLPFAALVALIVLANAVSMAVSCVLSALQASHPLGLLAAFLLGCAATSVAGSVTAPLQPHLRERMAQGSAHGRRGLGARQRIRLEDDALGWSVLQVVLLAAGGRKETCARQCPPQLHLETMAAADFFGSDDIVDACISHVAVLLDSLVDAVRLESASWAGEPLQVGESEATLRLKCTLAQALERLPEGLRMRTVWHMPMHEVLLLPRPFIQAWMLVHFNGTLVLKEPLQRSQWRTLVQAAAHIRLNVTSAYFLVAARDCGFADWSDFVGSVMLTACPHLQELRLDWTVIERMDAASLVQMLAMGAPNLRVLSLRGCIWSWDQEGASALVQRLAHELPALCQLHLGDNPNIGVVSGQGQIAVVM